METIDSDDLDVLESNTHSFIVKVWLEETRVEGGQVTWRGHITHVPGGERRHIKSLSEIIDFIFPYLETMNAKIEIHWRIRRLAKQWIRNMNHRLSTPERRS